MLGLLDVILRVPPLFVIDEILKISMGLGNLTFEDEKRNYTTNNVLTSANGTTDDIERVESEINYIADASEFYKFLSLTTLKFLICLLGEYKRYKFCVWTFFLCVVCTRFGCDPKTFLTQPKIQPMVFFLRVQISFVDITTSPI